MEKKFSINVNERNVSFRDWEIVKDIRHKGIYTLKSGDDTFTIESAAGSDRYVIFEENYNCATGRMIDWSYGFEDLATDIEKLFDVGFSCFDSLDNILDAAPNTFYYLNDAIKKISNRNSYALEC